MRARVIHKEHWILHQRGRKFLFSSGAQARNNSVGDRVCMLWNSIIVKSCWAMVDQRVSTSGPCMKLRARVPKKDIGWRETQLQVRGLLGAVMSGHICMLVWPNHGRVCPSHSYRTFAMPPISIAYASLLQSLQYHRQDGLPFLSLHYFSTEMRSCTQEFVYIWMLRKK